MIENVSEELFNKFLIYLERHLGLHYTPNTIDTLKSKLVDISKEFGYEDVELWMEWLIDSPISQMTITRLSKYLSIGETYFFRDAKYFNILKEYAITPLLENPKEEIKIWSAACSTGEEAYSIAIIIDMELNRSDKKTTIIGTDINPLFLDIAKEGLYREWSFRGVPDAIKRRYFTQNETSYLLNPDIRKMVTFAYLNLVDGYYPSVINNLNNFDLVVCNNVFIYFSPKQINRVVERIAQTLTEGGYLCVTPIEAPFIQHPDLQPIDQTYGFIFRKISTDHVTMHSLME